MKHRPTLALAFFGSSAHERSNYVDVSRARMSRLVNPCRQCSPASRLLNSVASLCANGSNPGQERPAASFFAVVRRCSRRREGYLTRRSLANGAADAQALETGLGRLGPGIVDAVVAATGGHR